MDTQSPSQNSLREIASDQLIALIASGVQRWPRPHLPECGLPSTNSSEFARSVTLKEDIEHCKKCSLSQTRRRVVCAPIVQKRFFVLADFPEPAEEILDAGPFEAPEAANNLLQRLFQRLGIWQDVFPSFAVKCFPKNNLPANSLEACLPNISSELSGVSPEIILCFGSRAARCLEESLRMSLPLTEMGEIPQATFETLRAQSLRYPALKNEKIWQGLKQIFFFPASRELRDYPEWRKQVWHELRRFTQSESSTNV